MKKILYLTYSNKYQGSRGDRHKNFIEHLKKNNHVHVINHNTQGNKISFTRRVVNRLLKKIILPDIERLCLKKYKKSLNTEIQRNKYDTVVLTILPFSFLLLVEFIRTLSNDINIILDVTDPVTINAQFKYFSHQKKKVFSDLEQQAFSKVNLLIVLNEEIKSYYEKKYPDLQSIVIEQGLNRFEHKISKYKESINNTLILLYAGIFYEGLREPYELYKAVKESSCPVRLDVYGLIKRSLRPPENNKFTFSGRISKIDLHQKYSNSDVIVFIDNKDTVQVPGKTLEVLGTEKPILFIYFNDNSPTFRYVKQFSGIYYTKNNDKGIRNSIEKIMSDACFAYSRDLSGYYWENLISRMDKYL